ncbi:MAG: S8 family serine peptidase [Candidatus Latescibacteria bacterium]|nr:S8 family serine peptidase [Candidatus Latescibacterota bacterium]
MSLHRPLKTISRLSLRVLLFTLMVVVPAIGFSQENDKLDPVLKKLIVSPDAAQTPALRPLVRTTGIEPTVGVFIRTTNGAVALDTPGLQVQTVIGEIVVAEVPISRLGDLAARPEVVSVHAAKVWMPLLDASVPETKANQVRSSYAVTGKNVIVGVIDTGIDWRHLDFRSATDTTKTRIKFLWDMSDNTGPPPGGTFATSGGTEYADTTINKAFVGMATVNERDVAGHGTHVAGIAAGNGRAGSPGGVYVGMAPEADLIIVKATRGSAQSFSSNDIVTAMDYIDAKAAQLNKPYVINLSLGGQQGPHDGTDTEGVAIDNLVGTGKLDKVVVASAGNDGTKRIHARGTLISSVVDSTKSFTASAGDNISIDIWTQVQLAIPNQVFISVAGPDTTAGPDDGFPTFVSDNSNGKVTIVSSPFGTSNINTDVNIVVKKSGTWSIKIRGNKGSASGRFDMWIYDGVVQFNAADGDTTTLVGAPGASKNAITVGAYVTKGSWTDVNGVPHTSTSGGVPVVVGNVSSFSSPGPTRDGRQKPEISAPGQVIGSSFSSDATPGNGTSIFQTANLLQDGKHAIAQGTSMSAPHVTGAVALFLEQSVKRSLSLDAIQVRSLFQSSAKTDVFTGTVPNDKWGYGKMDVERLFVNFFGLPNAVTLASFTVAANGRRVHLAWEVTSTSDHAGFHVYRSPSGREQDRRVITPQLLTGGPSLTYDDMPPGPGVYAYWLADVDLAGRTTFHGPVVVTFSTVPSTFRLGQSRPNPFNPTATIEYDVPRSEHVTLRVYDIMGREVRRLVNERQPAGFYQVVWDGRDDQGIAASSGVYFYKMTAGAFTQSRKMTLVK